MMKLSMHIAAMATLGHAKLVELDTKNFADTVSKGNVLVKFFAPWCGHCKTMKNGYEQAALDLETQTNAVVAEINCDRQENKTIMQKYNVRGFPTLLWFDADGNPKPYTSGRDQASVKEFVLENSAAAGKSLSFYECIDNLTNFFDCFTKQWTSSKRVVHETWRLARQAVQVHGRAMMKAANHYMLDMIATSPVVEKSFKALVKNIEDTYHQVEDVCTSCHIMEKVNDTVDAVKGFMGNETTNKNEL